MAFQYNHYYEIYNGGKYVNLNGDHENNVVNNGEKVTMYARTNNPDQRWALERYGSDNQVRIVLQRGGGWYALNYNTENTNCIVWHLNSAADKDTVITLEPAVSFGGVYRLKLAQRNLYLTVVGSSLKWMAFTNEKDQIFSFVEPGANPGSTKDEIDLPTNRTYNWSQFTSEVMNICGKYGCSLTCLILLIFLALASIPPMKFIRSASGPTLACFIGKFLLVAQVKSKRMATILVVRAMCLPLQKHRFRQTILSSSS